MSEELIVHWQGEDLEVEIGEYANGNPRIQLWSSQGPYGTASTNTCDRLKKGFVMIKNNAENTGIAEALIEAGIISKEPISIIESGYVEIPVYQLLV